jgi:hypothetical protein
MGIRTRMPMDAHRRCRIHVHRKNVVERLITEWRYRKGLAFSFVDDPYRIVVWTVERKEWKLFLSIRFR